MEPSGLMIRFIFAKRGMEVGTLPLEGRSMYLVFILSYVLLAVAGTGIFALIRARSIRSRNGEASNEVNENEGRPELRGRSPDPHGIGHGSGTESGCDEPFRLP